MNTQEKSKALATLMHWDLHKITEGADWHFLKVEPNGDLPTLEPYEDSVNGLAQFAAILLKFPDVVESFVCSSSHTDERSTTAERYARYGGEYQGYLTTDNPMNQKTILDEVLRIKGASL